MRAFFQNSWLRLSARLNAGPGGHRNRSIAAFFATSLAARGIGIGVQLVLVPLALKTLGTEAFGFLMTLTGLNALLTVADFGIGLGTQNRIAEAFGSGDGPRVRRLFYTSLAFLSLLAVALAGLVVPLCWVLNWPHLLKLTDPRAVDGARASAMLLAVVCCAGLPLGLSQRLFFGLQMGWVNNIALIAGGLLTLLSVLLTSALHLGLFAFMAGNFLPGALVSVVMLVFGMRRLRTLREPAAPERLFDRSELPGLAKIGALFFVQQLCAMAVFGLPPVMISATLGAAAVTPYNLGQRLFNMLAIPQNAFLLPLWPAYAEAKARRDWPWVRKALARSLWMTVALSLIPMAAAAFVARPLLRLWTGAVSELPAPSLVAVLCIWNMLAALQQPFGFFLAGMSEVRRMTAYSVATVLSSVLLMSLLGPRFGAEGVVLGLICSLGGFSLLGSASETWKFLRTLRDDPASPHASLEPPVIAAPMTP
jgi:O-antigen/teichoic acid export membrane protein